MQMLRRMQMTASLTRPPVISRRRVHIDTWTRFSLRCEHVAVTATFTSAELGILYCCSFIGRPGGSDFMEWQECLREQTAAAGEVEAKS